MRLSCLFLDPTSSPTLVTEWLLQHLGEHKPQTIQLCRREPDSTKTVDDLLRASGSTPESLHIEFPARPSSLTPTPTPTANHSDPDRDAVVLWDDSSLALCALHFGGLDAHTVCMFFKRPLFPWVTAMVSHMQARSPELQEASFPLEIADLPDLLALDWDPGRHADGPGGAPQARGRIPGVPPAPRG